MEILCDNCQEELKHINADYKELLQAFHFLAEYFWTELGWEHFRAQFLTRGDKAYETERLNNAKKIADALEIAKIRWPSVKNTIAEAT